MTSVFASLSRYSAPLISTPSRAASAMAVSALVGTAMRIPVPKSVMSTHTARVASEARVAASHATPNVGSTSLPAKSSASRCKVRGFDPTVLRTLSIFAASV